MLAICNDLNLNYLELAWDPAARGTCPSEGEEEVSQCRRNHLNCNGFGLLHRRN